MWRLAKVFRHSRGPSHWPSNRSTLYLGLLFGTCVYASFSAPSNLPAQDTSGPFTIKQQVNLVELPVTVRDHEGRFVSTLQMSNFRVYEDGRPQEITLFRNEDIPVTVGLVVDHSGSMAAKQLEVAEGAQAFVQASNPQDREFVVNFADEVSFGLRKDVAFTSNIDELRTALSSVSASGRTALYDAVAAALENIQNDSLDKKVLLLISDGGDNASKHNFAQVLRMAQTLNVIIYSIGLFDQYSADQNPKVLKKLSEETGGYAYFPTSYSEVISVCRQIADDIRHQYTLTYSPTDLGRSGYRKIRVTVTAPNRGKLLVRTRAGYYFPAPTSAGEPSEISEPHTGHAGP
jgi:Ca-activated chloride channel family protein